MFMILCSGAGDLFGEDICKRSCTLSSKGDVKALMYCEVLYLCRDEIQGILLAYPNFSNDFSKSLHLCHDLTKKLVCDPCFYYLNN